MAHKSTNLWQLKTAVLRMLSDVLDRVAAVAENAADAIETLQNGKQDKLTGAAGQVVGFDSAGNPAAQNNAAANVLMSDGTTTVEAALAGKLPLAGGTMTGPIKYKAGAYTATPITVYDGDSYGVGLVIQGGGLTIIGGGEAASALYNALIADGATAATEQLHLGSDTTMSIHVNCQTIANRVTITIDKAGKITAPGGFGGNSDSATKLATARTLTVGNTGKSFNGSADVSWSIAEIGALPLAGGTMTGPIKFQNSSMPSRTGHDFLVGIDAFADGGTLKWSNASAVNVGSATKLATARTIRTNLASTSTASFDGSANVTPGVTGILPAANGGTGNANGTAAKLTTARTIQTNLASTATASFDGSANITPGVTGTLPIANGGTGNTTGLAASATKLATARTIDGVSFDGSAAITHYGTCSTAAATAAKEVSLSGFTLAAGALVFVKFTYANSASSPTLNVNSTGAVAIKRYGTTAAATYMWYAGAVVGFMYDGTNWIMLGGTMATTTYYGLVKLSSSTSSTSTALAATPSAVKAAYDLASGKQDKTLSGSLMIPTSGWTASTVGSYLYYIDVAVSDITGSDHVHVDVAPASLAYAVTCGLCPTCETVVGAIRFRAVAAPTTAITATYWVEPIG